MSSNLIGKNNRTETEWLDLRGLFYDLLEHKWMVLGITLCVTLCGILFVSTKIPLYQANVLMQIANKSHGNLMSGLSQQLNFGAASEDSAAVQSALIRSRFILEPVIQSLGLDITAAPHQIPYLGRFFSKKKHRIEISEFKVPSSSNNKPLNLVFDQANHYQLYNSEGDLILQSEFGKLAASKDQSYNLRVQDINAPIGEQFILVKHSTPAIIQKLLPRIKITDLGLTSGGEASRTGILQISMTDTNPHQLVRILNAIIKTVQVKDMEKKSLEAAKTLNFLNQQLPIVKADLEKAEAKLNLYRAHSGRIDTKLQTQYIFNQLAEVEKELQAVNLNKMDLSQKYTPLHPFMIALNKKENELELNRKKLHNKLNNLPATDQVVVNLLRDVKVKNSLYLILLNKIQELQVVKAGTVSDIRILSLAKIPDESLPMSRGLICIATLFFGFISGCLIVWSKKAFFHHIEDPHWLEKNLNLINLVIIPYSKKQAIGTHALKLGIAKELPLLAASDPHDYSIESLRSLRTSIQVMLPSANNKIISVMGISPGVGKTFVSSNFSYLLADTGKRVLLIDGDIRRGHLHKYFNAARTPGLMEVINGTVQLEEALKPCKTLPNLFLLPTGKFPENPSEIIMSDRFKWLMNAVAEQFDLVVIDTAPILAVTDGVLIAAFASINFLVIGSKTHQPGEVEIAMKRVSNAGVKLQGYIFNNVRQESKIYGYSRYQYYYTYKTEKNSLS